MTIIKVTAAEIDGAIVKASIGTTLELHGAFPDPLPLKVKPAKLTLDCSDAALGGNTRTAAPGGLTILGGTWTGSLNFTDSRSVVILGGLFAGPPERLLSALAFQKVIGLTIRDVALSEYMNGIVGSEIDTFEMTRIGISGMRKDCIQLAAVWRGLFDKIVGHGTRSDPDDHCDGIQLRSLSLKADGTPCPPTSDIAVKRSRFTGAMQGVNQTHKAGNGGFDRIVYEDIQTCVTMPTGIGMLAVRDGTLRDCHAETYPGALNQSRVYVAEDCTNVKYEGVVSHEPYRTKAGRTYT